MAQFLDSRRSRIGRWGGAAVIVCALHVGGGALALMHWQEEDDEDAAGALTVEMVPLPAAAPVDSPDLAHGPLTQDAVQTPQATEKVEEEVVRDLPPVDPSPAPEPEVALPKPQPEQKEEPEKKDEPKETVAEKERPAEASEQQIATAPPRVEAQPAPSSARLEGLSASVAREQRRWTNDLTARIKRFKRYPDAASRRGIRGVTIVRFTVDRSGQVLTSEVLQSSGSSILDEEALALIKRAGPFPVPPDAIPDKFLANDVPIWFGMKPDR